MPHEEVERSGHVGAGDLSRSTIAVGDLQRVRGVGLMAAVWNSTMALLAIVAIAGYWWGIGGLLPRIAAVFTTGIATYVIARAPFIGMWVGHGYVVIRSWRRTWLVPEGDVLQVSVAKYEGFWSPDYALPPLSLLRLSTPTENLELKFTMALPRTAKRRAAALRRLIQHQQPHRHAAPRPRP